MLEVEKRDGTGLYDQIRELRGIQWPAPTYEIAKAGGTPRRYLGQEGWAGKPYGAFRHPDGKARMKLCEQDYSQIHAVTAKLMQFGHRDRPGEGPFLIDELAPPRRRVARTFWSRPRHGVPPELPDLHIYDDIRNACRPQTRGCIRSGLGLGIVYEHFHSEDDSRCTTMKLIPEQYRDESGRRQTVRLRDGIRPSDDSPRRFECSDGRPAKELGLRGKFPKGTCLVPGTFR
jgi:nitrate reductase NapA